MGNGIWGKGLKLFAITVVFISIASVIAKRTSHVDLENLSLYRPVTVSTTGHYPTIAEFAVDGEMDTGWRSARKRETGEDADWLTVDLQVSCQINLVKITWAASADRPVFEAINTAALFGGEQVAAYGLSYTVLFSSDGQTWKRVYTTTYGRGGAELIYVEPTEASYVRVVIDKRSHPKCGVEIRELSVMGTCDTDRPKDDNWKLRRKKKVNATPTAIAPKANDVLLDTGWELMCQDRCNLTAAEITDVDLDTTAWYNATVPGTVLTTLVNQEVFSEPTVGMNNLKIPDSLCRHAWWYRTELAIPSKWIKDRQRLWLEFDAINHHAEVWLNAHYLGSINGAFKRGNFDITDALNTAGRNILAVRVLPPSHPGIPLEKCDRDKLINGGALGKDSPTFVASIGWDWMPGVRDRGTGIWGDVHLRRTGTIVIGDPQIVTDLPLPDISRADISITVPVQNTSGRQQKVSVGVEFEGLRISKMVSVDADATTEVKFTPASNPELRLENPRLWWPTGYGEQSLYDLTLSAKVDGVVSDTHATRFGVRELSYRGSELYSRKTDFIDFAPVQTRYVRLNCLTRASRYGFSLFTFSVLNSRQPDMDLAQGEKITASTIESAKHPAQHANDNDPQTRWASETSEPHWLCVDLGVVKTVDQVQILWEAAYAKHFAIQVSDDGQSWKDVKNCILDNEPGQLEISVNGQRVLCRGGNWGYPEMLLRLSDERLEASIRLHHEANLTMIRNWVGQNTTKKFYDYCDRYGILIWNDFWLANPSDGPDPDDEQLFLENVRDAVLQYRNHPSIAIWCGRNEGMPPKKLDEGMRQLTAELDGTRYYQSHSADRGVCGHGPYRYMPPKRYFEDLNHGFKTEMGMPSVPSAESMRKMLDDSNPWPIDGRWTYHDFAPIAAQTRDGYIKALETKFGSADSLDDFCRKAQMINYDGYRALFEGCNHKLWNDCSGLLLWMSHPAWPSTVWQIYDYWYGTDGAYFGTQKANEPIHIQYCPTNDMVELINHTANSVKGSATATVLGLDASVLWQKELVVEAGDNRMTEAFDVQWPDNLPDAYLLKLEWTDLQKGILSENIYWLSREQEGLRALDSMPKVKLKSTLLKEGKDQFTIQLVNDTQDIALMTKATLRDAMTNERILPAYYSDNYISLLPGESKTITVSCTEKDADKKMNIGIDGWNIEAIDIK